MTEKDVEKVAPAERQVFKLSDDAILMVRELIQLSLLTGTNIVDHFRALQMEPIDGKAHLLAPTPEYIDAYNDMVKKLNEEALKQQEEAQKTAAVEE